MDTRVRRTSSRSTARNVLAFGVALLAVLHCPALATADDAGRADAGAADAGAARPRIVPPHIVHQPDVVYPPEGDGRRVDVELLLTVDEHGAVAQAEVLGHVPADAVELFDVAARTAARTIRFEPARLGDQPVPVRLRFHMAITPPVVSLDAGPPATGDAATTPEIPDEEMGSGAEGITHVHPGPSGATRTQVASREPSSAPPSAASIAPEPGVNVRGERAPESRGASDYFAVLGALRTVPRANASDILRLAPGILLTNEGGQGHAEQVFLRGFDAREGQDLEFTVNGVPFNEAGNPHGEGLANSHFIIPELVHAIRVLEGPFDPHQGNYAVAGSADYELGLDQRGLTLQYTGGSFNTHRFLALWGPEDGARGTFAGVDLQSTDGFGTNRSARYGRAMAQYELQIAPTTTLRILGTSYLTHYGSAGVVREDDFEAGRISFFGSYDNTQGGDEGRHSLSLSIEDDRPDRTLRQQVFVVLRNMRLIENYTGYLQDPPAEWSSSFAQRGDAVDQNENATTFGARGSIRLRAPWEGLTQAIEVGYYARYDMVDSSQRRLRAGSTTPYRVNFDLNEGIANAGMYLDTELRPFRWFVMRGGVRGDYFSYDVLNRCDLHDASLGSSGPAAATVDVLCYSRDRTGPRDPTARRSSSGLAVQPRASVLLGPFEGLSITGSAGIGARAADPAYLAQGNFAPFASVLAGEAGGVFNRRFGSVGVTLRALYYYTHVSQDLIFNEQEGRNTLAPGTERQGMIAAGRLTGRWFDWSASVTYADARFQRQPMDPGSTYFPADQGNRVPYVPQWVVRSDSVVFGSLPWLRMARRPFVARAGVGLTYVSPRALPYGESGDPMFLVDATAGLRWRFVELGVIAQNLFDARYRLGEYNYVSEFRANTPTPNLVPARTFTAGAPLGVYATLTLYFGPDAVGGGI